MKLKTLSLAIGLALTVSALASERDFGQLQEALLKDQSEKLFGVTRPVGASSSLSLTAAQAEANPAALVTVARGLKVKVISAAANLGANVDQMALWPNEAHPTHLIACNEQGVSQVGLQRVEIATGMVENIVSSGLTSCDPVRRTAWGTVIFGEENGKSGRMFELLDPLTTTGVTISGSGALTTPSSDKVKFLSALGQLSFEGIALYSNGLMYYGDESRPSDKSGGAYFKFVPINPYQGDKVTNGISAIKTLADSPLASGRVFGMRLGRNGTSINPNSNTDFGQGNEFGRGWWLEVTGPTPFNLRDAAAAMKLTSYYRPEDMDLDPKALAAGKIQFCGNNTGQDAEFGDNHWGETFCITDGTLEQASDVSGISTTAAAGYNALTASTPEYQLLNMGHRDFAMPDNIAYQPGRDNWLINEDGDAPGWTAPRNNDIWSCLDDGADQDILADGCVKVVTLNDLTAESTGGIFDASGKRYFVSIQHNITGHGVILEIDGWK